MQISRCRSRVQLSLLLCAAVSYGLPFKADSQSQVPQLNSINNQTQTPIPGAGHDYQHLLGETVNFSNGSVSFKISFPVPRSRAFTLPFSWTYNSAAVNSMDAVGGNTPTWNDSTSHFWPKMDGWNLNEGTPIATAQVFTLNSNGANPFTGKVETGNIYVPCNFESGLTFTDMDGVVHNLLVGAYAPQSTSSGSGIIPTCGTAMAIPPGGDGQVVATINPQLTLTSLGTNKPTSGPFSVMDKNGIVYQFYGGVNSASPGNGFAPYSITDRNGNVAGPSSDTMGRPGPVTFSGNPAPTATEPSTVTVTVNPGSAAQQVFTSTWNTTSADYTVNSANSRLQEAGQAIGCQPFPPTVGPQTVAGTPVPGADLRNVLSSLTLPNGQSFTLHYGNDNADSTVRNSYGLLNEIVYPDGGWIKYTWQLSSGFNEMSSVGGSWEVPLANGSFAPTSVPYGCIWQYQTPVLASRQVSFNGTTVAQVQNFTYTTAWQSDSSGQVDGWTQKTNTVVSTDNQRGGISSTTVYTYTPYYPPKQSFAASGVASAIPLESTITYSDWGSSTILKSVKKQWFDQFNLASEITSEYESGGPPRISETAYMYQTGLCNNIQLPYTSTGTDPLTNPVGSLVYLTEQDDYDFGTGKPGPLVKKTLYNYKCFQPPFPNSGDPVSTIPPEISSVTVEDGNGNINSATQYGFDGATPTALQYSVTNATYGASVTVRGNVTSVVKCNPLPSNPTATCTGPTTSYALDTTGQPVSVKDPIGNTTTFSFADSFTDHSPSQNTNAYLTNVTEPLISGASLHKTFTYSYWLGYLTGSSDENNQTTSYSYNTPSAACSGTDGNTDGMDRLSEVDYPDHGKTYYCYNDAALTSTKKVLLDVIASQDFMTNVSQFDGMGHATEAYLTSDPDGTTSVDTTYDGEGQVLTVSNPHRGAGPSGTVTTQYYDALGRKVETSEPDGSVLQWCYNGLISSVAPAAVRCSQQLGTVASTLRPGTWVDFTDERTNAWQRSSDVFGNLTEVMEPNGSGSASTMETDYIYDTLNNLTAVAQYGGPYAANAARARTFSYDSLSRLSSAFNPETGTIGYTYDLNSNVYTKTDARGVTTSYGYDPLNRLLSKTYSGDQSGTAASCYQYGTSSDPSNFTGGRLINAWTQAAQSCGSAPASYITSRAVQQYDAMGRLEKERQYTLASQATAKVYQPQYFYDLAGELISSTDGITPSPTTPGTTLTFTNSFANGNGGAGRVLTVNSNWNDSTHPALLFSQGTTQSSTCTGSPTWQYYPFGGLSNAAFGSGLTFNRTYDVRLRTNCELDLGTGATPATPGSAVVTIFGAEQSK